MNNTHKSIEPSKNEEELHFCNWAAMGAELQPKTLSFFNFNKNSQNPFNTIHWTQQSKADPPKHPTNTALYYYYIKKNQLYVSSQLWRWTKNR